MSCCGNPWAPGPGMNTPQVCGQFTEPENQDQGQCSPYREKRDCEAPVRPLPECNDTEAYAEYDPNGNPKFIIVATIFDENCEPIQDQNGAPIMAQY